MHRRGRRGEPGDGLPDGHGAAGTPEGRSTGDGDPDADGRAPADAPEALAPALESDEHEDDAGADEACGAEDDDESIAEDDDDAACDEADADEEDEHDDGDDADEDGADGEETIFRESAAEQLTSPEQLDRTLEVIGARGWAALVALWALLAAIVAWAIVGSVPTREEGAGILVPAGGLRQVVATGTGRLTDLRTRVGEFVEPDEVIAIIDRQEVRDLLLEAESRLDELIAQDGTLDEFESRESEVQQALADVEQARLRRLIEFSRERLERLRTRRELVTRLIADGALSAIEIERLDEERETITLSIERATLELEQSEARLRNAEFERRRGRLERSLRIDEMRRRAGMLAARLERESLVRSPVRGRVVEIRAAMHAAITVGDPVMLLEPLDEQFAVLEAVLYVSAATGRRIQRGMPVELTPSTVRREEHGSLVGTVSFIADVPTSKSAMMAVLSDADMVERFTQRIGLPLEMRVALVPDPGTPSGFRWTSAEGPPIAISAGTLCDGAVTIRRQSPLSLVIPALRRSLDGE